MSSQQLVGPVFMWKKATNINIIAQCTQNILSVFSRLFTWLTPQEAVEDVSAAGSKAGHGVSGALSSAGNNIKGAAHKAGDKLSHAAHEIEDKAEDNKTGLYTGTGCELVSTIFCSTLRV